MEIDKLHDVYLALGTNLGNKEENIVQAMKHINERVGMLIAHSSFCITEPVGFDSPNQFVNAVCLVMTSLLPLQLLEATQEIEVLMGRESKSKGKLYADRIIDIDILLYDDLIMEDEQLRLPHPHLHEREFVLFPLLELADNYVHPTLGQTLWELAERLKNQ